MTIKDLKFLKINSVDPSYFIFSEVNGYFEEINKVKNSTLAIANESKKKKLKI